MSEFRKLVESILKENGINDEIVKLFQFYANELNEKGQIRILDREERNAFNDYCYNHYEDLPFDPDDLRLEGDLIYLI